MRSLAFVVAAALATLAAAAPSARADSLEDLGFAVEPLEDGLGVRVVKVAADSPAARAGLLPDDWIVEAGGAPVRTSFALGGAAAIAGNAPLALTVMRAGRFERLTIRGAGATGLRTYFGEGFALDVPADWTEEARQDGVRFVRGGADPGAAAIAVAIGPGRKDDDGPLGERYGSFLRELDPALDDLGHVEGQGGTEASVEAYAFGGEGVRRDGARVRVLGMAGRTHGQSFFLACTAAAPAFAELEPTFRKVLDRFGPQLAPGHATYEGPDFRIGLPGEWRVAAPPPEKVRVREIVIGPLNEEKKVVRHLIIVHDASLRAPGTTLEAAYEALLAHLKAATTFDDFEVFEKSETRVAGIPALRLRGAESYGIGFGRANQTTHAFVLTTEAGAYMVVLAYAGRDDPAQDLVFENALWTFVPAEGGAPRVNRFEGPDLRLSYPEDWTLERKGERGLGFAVAPAGVVVTLEVDPAMTLATTTLEAYAKAAAERRRSFLNTGAGAIETKVHETKDIEVGGAKAKRLYGSARFYGSGDIGFQEYDLDRFAIAVWLTEKAAFSLSLDADPPDYVRLRGDFDRLLTTVELVK